MHTSPQPRFYRTSKLCYSPTQSEKHGCQSPNPKTILNIAKEPIPISSNFLSEDRKLNKPKADDKIANLQQMLESEKSKRKLEVNELFKIINSLKEGQRKELIDQPQMNFSRQSHQVTPRVRSKQNNFSHSPRHSEIYQNYSSFQEPLSNSRRPKSNMVLNEQEESEDFFQRSMDDFQFQSLQLLIQKVERESQFNNRNLMRMQQQIYSLRSSLPMVQSSTKVSFEVEKFVEASNQILKRQIQNERISMKEGLMEEVQDLIKKELAKIKESKENNAYLQVKKVNERIDSLEEIFGTRILDLDSKASNQVTAISEIVNEKLKFFKDSLLNQLVLDQKDWVQDIKRDVEQQKRKMEELQEAHADFYRDLESSIVSIQNQIALKMTTSRDLKPQHLDIIQQLIDMSSRKLTKELQQLTSTLQNKLSQTTSQTQQKIHNLQNIFQISKTNRLTKSDSLSSTSTNIVHQQYSIVELENRTDNSDQDCDSKDKGKWDMIIQMVSENCTFLEARNIAIQESLRDIISVLNQLVEKLKNVI